VAVAAFGDASLPALGAAGILAGDEAEVGHELARVLEAAQITQLGGERHGGDKLEAFEPHEVFHGPRPRPGFHLFLHFRLDPLDARIGTVQGEEILFQDEALVGGEFELAQVAEVGGTP